LVTPFFPPSHPRLNFGGFISEAKEQSYQGKAGGKTSVISLAGIVW